MEKEETTTICLPFWLADKIREGASQRGLEQAEYLHLATKEFEQAEFLRAVAAIEWDEEAIQEARDIDEEFYCGVPDPYETTIQAMEDARSGRVTRVKDLDALFQDLQGDT